MRAGSRITAPEGFRNLSQGLIYHFLCSDGLRNRVRLVQFEDAVNKLSSHLIELSQIDFEEAVEKGWLLEDGPADSTPPWLEHVKGISIAHLEDCRVSKKKSYEQMVDERFAAISNLLARRDEIFSDDHPDALINKEAKAQKPQQNASRLRLWFYTYIVFGQTKWSLLPLSRRRGKWDREGPGKTRKLGRPSRRGKRHGWPATPISALQPVADGPKRLLWAETV